MSSMKTKVLRDAARKDGDQKAVEQQPEEVNVDPVQPEPWGPPIPFCEFSVPEFPVESLATWQREWVQAEAEATQTPVDLPAWVSISACEIACAGKVEVHPRDGWWEPTNGFTVVGLNPGTRKSAVFKDGMQPVNDFERLEIERLRPIVAEAQTEHKILEKRLAYAQERASKAEAEEREELEREACALSREIADAVLPVLPQLITDDCSPERLASLMAAQGGRMAVCSPEGDIFEIMAGRYSKGANLGVFLKGHAGDQLRVDRIGRAAEFVESPALTIGLSVQPDVIAGMANQPMFRGRGLTARFRFCIPVSTVGNRRIDADPVSPATVAKYHRAITKLLSLDYDRDDQGKYRPHILRLEQAALEELLKFAAWVEPQLADGSDLGPIADWGSKLVGSVVRLAGVLHMAENFDHSAPWEKLIALETIRAAITVGRYLIPHARAAFALMVTDPIVDDARRALAWIEREALGQFTKRDLFNAMRGRLKRAEEMEPILDLLAEHSVIREVRQNRQGPGRKPSPTYEVNPHTHNTHNPQKSGPDGNCAHSANSAYGSREVF